MPSPFEMMGVFLGGRPTCLTCLTSLTRLTCLTCWACLTCRACLTGWGWGALAWCLVGFL